MIIKEITLIDDLLANSNNYYPDRIKFCIHKPTKTLSIDLYYHIDMEHEVIWEAHPNIQRNVELGTPQNGRTLKDQKIIDELFDILKYWIR